MEYIKNRFDEKKPFDTVRAEDFGDALFEFYEPLEGLLRSSSGVDIKDGRPLFLIGGRGSGKTMILKFLSLRMQVKHFIKENLKNEKKFNNLSSIEMKNFLKRQKFVGIYLHFRTYEYDIIKGDLAPLFLPYLSLKIAEQIFKSLSIFKSSKLISVEEEERIVRYFFDQIRKEASEEELNIDFAINYIANEFIPKFEILFEKSSYYTLDELKEKYEIPVILHKNIIFGLPDFIFSSLKFLSRKQLFILLDELEFLNESQIRSIGKLIKDSDETSVVFKVGSRFMPHNINVGESNEILQESHDFRKINITDTMNATFQSHKKGYPRLIKKILNKRLEKSEYFKKCKITDIEKLFPNPTLEKEALDLVKGRTKHWDKFKTNLKSETSNLQWNKTIQLLSYPQNPIIEKLNMLLVYRKMSPESINKMFNEYLAGKNEKYKSLYDKNGFNLLIQLYSDYRTEMKYAGIDTFIYLSSGIVRYAIELCNRSLNFAYNYGFDPQKENSIDQSFQGMASKDLADTVYSDVLGIPDNVGIKVQTFIGDIGTIFRDLHLNPYLIEPEPTHFETIYSEITGGAKLAFDSALEHSYLQEKKAMIPKDENSSKMNDFVLNRIFTPKFGISYHTRGRTKIKGTQIIALMEGKESDRKAIRREIITQNTKKNPALIFNVKQSGTQKTLFE